MFNLKTEPAQHASAAGEKFFWEFCRLFSAFWCRLLKESKPNTSLSYDNIFTVALNPSSNTDNPTLRSSSLSTLTSYLDNLDLRYLNNNNNKKKNSSNDKNHNISNLENKKLKNGHKNILSLNSKQSVDIYNILLDSFNDVDLFNLLRIVSKSHSCMFNSNNNFQNYNNHNQLLNFEDSFAYHRALDLNFSRHYSIKSIVPRFLGTNYKNIQKLKKNCQNIWLIFNI